VDQDHGRPAAGDPVDRAVSVQPEVAWLELGWKRAQLFTSRGTLPIVVHSYEQA
jgi:hypothetical protein